MRKCAVTVLILFICIAALITSSRSNHNLPKSFNVTGVGFTNNAAGRIEALFRVDGPDSGRPRVAYGVSSFQECNGGTWSLSVTPTQESNYWDSNGDHIIGLQVSKSNTCRAVIEFHERRRGISGMLDNWRDAADQRASRGFTPRFGGKTYYGTGEVIAASN